MHSHTTAYQPRQPSHSRHIPLRGQHYHLRHWGAPLEAARSAPPLILLHGWMDVGASFQFFIEALPAHWLARRPVIAPDWRGFGHTRPLAGPPPDHYQFVDYLADLDALLHHLWGPSQPVDILGHSMGGHAAMLYAGARPARVRRLINVEGFGLPATQPDQAPARYTRWLDDLQALQRGELALRPYPSLAAVAERLRRNNPRLPADKALWLAQHWSTPTPGPHGQTHYRLLGQPAHRVINPQLFRVEETLALYRCISAPVLMVQAAQDSIATLWGHGSGRLQSFSQAEFAQRLAHVPQLHTQHLPDCGHMLHHDQPAALAALVQDFLA